MNKYKIVFYIIGTIIAFYALLLNVNAHDSCLGIEGYDDIYYDDCESEEYVSSSDIGDGLEEKWYSLTCGSINENDVPNTYVELAMYHIE